MTGGSPAPALGPSGPGPPRCSFQGKAIINATLFFSFPFFIIFFSAAVPAVSKHTVGSRTQIRSESRIAVQRTGRGPRAPRKRVLYIILSPITQRAHALTTAEVHLPENAQVTQKKKHESRRFAAPVRAWQSARGGAYFATWMAGYYVYSLEHHQCQMDIYS